MLDYDLTWLGLGFILGNVFCFFVLYVPIDQVHKRYIARLEKRLEERK